MTEEQRLTKNLEQALANKKANEKAKCTGEVCLSKADNKRAGTDGEIKYKIIDA